MGWKGGGTRAGPEPRLPSLEASVGRLSPTKPAPGGLARRASQPSSPTRAEQGTRWPESLRVTGHAGTLSGHSPCAPGPRQGCWRCCGPSCWCSWWRRRPGWARAVSAETKASASVMGPKERRGRKAFQDPQVLLARRDSQVRKACLDHRDPRALQDLQDSLVPKA